MTWMTLWWLVLFVVGASVFPLAWVAVGRVYHRWAVRDPVRRSKARARRRKVPGSGPWNFVAFLIIGSLWGGIFLPYEFGVPFPVTVDFSSAVTFRLIAVVSYLETVVVAFAFAWSFLSFWREKRFFDCVEREEHLICPDCHYSLEGHAAGGHCPECGYTFTPESLLEDWADVKKLARRRVSP